MKKYFKTSYLLLVFIIFHYSLDDGQIFDTIIKNVADIDTAVLFQEFNDYFNQLNHTIKDNKVIAVYSYNKNLLAKMFSHKPESIGRCHHLLNVKFKDNIKLFYLAGSKFPYQKFIKIILYSEKKLKFLSFFNESLSQSIRGLFLQNRNKFFIHHNPFNMIMLDPSMGEQVIKINKDMLGNGNINIKITTMETIIIQKSLDDKFLLMIDNTLMQLEYFVNIYEKSQEGFHSDKFFSLKASIFFNFFHKTVNKKLHDVNQSQWTNNYIFNEKKEDIARKYKLKIINYFTSRDILLKVYEYIY